MVCMVQSIFRYAEAFRRDSQVRLEIIVAYALSVLYVCITKSLSGRQKMSSVYNALISTYTSSLMSFPFGR